MDKVLKYFHGADLASAIQDNKFLYSFQTLSARDFKRLMAGQTVNLKLFEPFPQGWFKSRDARSLRSYHAPKGNFTPVLVKMPVSTPPTQILKLIWKKNVVWYAPSKNKPATSTRFDARKYTWYATSSYTDIYIRDTSLSPRMQQHDIEEMRNMGISEAVIREEIEASRAFTIKKMCFVGTLQQGDKWQVVVTRYDKLKGKIMLDRHVIGQEAYQELIGELGTTQKLDVTPDNDDLVACLVTLIWQDKPGDAITSLIDHLHVKPQYKTKAPYLYRGIVFPSEVLQQLKNGQTIKLRNEPVSSWTDNPGVARQFGTVIKKQSRPKDIIVSIDLLHNHYGIVANSYMNESEALIRNTPYWLTVSPDEIEELQTADQEQMLADMKEMMQSLASYYEGESK